VSPEFSWGVFPDVKRRKLPLLLFIPVCILLLFPELQGDQNKENEKQEEKIMLSKSLLFPGLGQLSEKQYFKGLVFAVSETVCIIAAIHLNRKADQAYWQYRQAGEIESAVLYRRLTEKRDRRRNLWIAAGAGIWAANLIDAWLFQRRREKAKVRLGVSSHGDKGIAFSLIYSVD